MEFSLDNYLNKSENVLNVHGLSHGAAWCAVIMFIEQYWDKKNPFTLITGKGLHSKQEGLYRMRIFLQQKIEDRYPNLSCQVNMKNEGRLNISDSLPS